MTDQSAGILFSMGSELKEDLENGKFSERLRQQFTNNNVPLSQNVTIPAKEGHDTWEIHDEVEGIIYVIKKEDDSLNIYSASLEYYLKKLRYELESVGDKSKWGDTPVTGLQGQVIEIADRFRTFREKLGIYTGGFFFYNPQKNDVDPLFNEEEYPFEYATIGKENRDLLDKIFLAWRKQDRLNVLENQGYPADYFSYLLPPKDKSFLELDGSVLRTKYSAHYCTLGEVLFFMFSWRFLLPSQPSQASCPHR